LRNLPVALVRHTNVLRTQRRSVNMSAEQPRERFLPVVHVAIKMLPEEFARNSDRVARFQREAEVLASLNHPNIAGIYDLQHTDETHFLVIRPALGSDFQDNDDQTGARIAIISDSLWRRRFAASRDIIGRSIARSSGKPVSPRKTSQLTSPISPMYSARHRQAFCRRLSVSILGSINSSIRSLRKLA
jgi:hypothetical protein